jgi:hypothetical protein
MVNRIGGRRSGVLVALVRVSKTRLMMVVLAVLIASFAVTVSSASAGMLIGNASVQSGTDSNDGAAEAFPFTSSAGGTATEASVYIDSASTATGLIVGLYSDSSGAPGALLGQASRSSPVSGAWNTLSFPSVSITAQTPYWLAILGTGGQLNFRDDSTDGSCRSVTSGSTSIMPSSFSPSWWDTCNVSAYLSTSDSAAPVSDSPPTISGDFSYYGSGEAGWGGTVTATEGTWTSSDSMTYSFQWQECDSSGGNCSNVPPTGMFAPDQYTISPGEVGNTIRVAVTATNSYGSTTAYSDSSPVITAS